MNFEAFDEPILIRFDGLDAERHMLEVDDFATSLSGFGRIISVAAQFAVTQKHVHHKDAMDVRVVVKAPEPNCVTVAAIVQLASTNPLISGTTAALLATLITYIFKRAAGRKEEMKYLKESLEPAIKELGNRDTKVVEGLLGTIDKMADQLKPAAKKAVRPLGRSARTVTVGDGPSPGTSPLVMDVEDRDAIEASADTEVSDEQTFEITIVEMNLDRSTSRVSFVDDPESRVNAEIVDPAIQMPNNDYALAFAAQTPLKVRAKSRTKSGELDKLYISDTA